ncbi:MAG: glycosyltransferase [Bdellovibrionota bacterium]
MDSTFTIAILSYNHPEITSRCVESVLKYAEQSTPIVLIHNGSADQHRNLLQHRFPEIEHVVLQKNIGFSGGADAVLRFGFQQSPWVLFLTNDTHLQTPVDQISRGIDNLLPGMYAPKIIWPKSGQTDSWGGWLSLLNGELRHEKTGYFRSDKENCFYVPGSAFLIHRDAYFATAGFDQSFGTYWEDVDLSLQFQACGLPLGTVDFLELTHLGGKTCRKDSTYTIFYYFRNQRKVLNRWLPKLVSRPRQFKIVYCIWIKTFKKFYSLARQSRWTDMKKLVNSFNT